MLSSCNPEHGIRYVTHSSMQETVVQRLLLKRLRRRLTFTVRKRLGADFFSARSSYSRSRNVSIFNTDARAEHRACSKLVTEFHPGGASRMQAAPGVIPRFDTGMTGHLRSCAFLDQRNVDS
jgi:hypothetical protein